MAKGTLTAPVHPQVERASLRSKGKARTPAETAKYVALLEAELDDRDD